MKVLVTITLLLGVMFPAYAEAVTIPPACAEIAQRFGIPQTLTKEEAALARRRLAELPIDFPGAAACRAALSHRHRSK